MAKISAFKVNSKARQDGEWIAPGEDWDDLEILTRSYTDAYVDARNARMRKAAMQRNLTDTSKVPSAVARSITVECMIEHVLLGVRNLKDEAGEDVTFAAFCNLIRDPDFGDLFTAATVAASMVGRKRDEDTSDAAGNSAAPSA